MAHSRDLSALRLVVRVFQT